MQSSQPLELSPAQAEALEQEMMRLSPLYFATKVLSGNASGTEHDGKFVAGQHHVEWDQLITQEKAKRICVLAPRDHGKSQFWNKALPIWKAKYGRPGDLGYIFSVNQEKAIEMLEQITNEVITNPKLQHLAPRNYEQTWSKRRVVFTTGVEIRARGFGVSVRGGHPNWIINDDVLSDENITSETIRKKAIDYFLSAITNMCVPGGEIFVVGTPMNEQDVYAVLRANGAYRMWEKPAIDKQGNALWPARYNKALLDAKKKEIGNARFTREFQVKPFSDDMSLFPSYLFEGKPTRQPTLKLGQGAAYWNALGVTKRYMGVDIAMSSETGADYFVIVVLGRDAKGNRWVCDIVREKGLGLRAQLDLINKVGKRLDPSLIFIEANHMQRIWGDELIRETDLPVKKFITSGAGKTKTTNTSQTSNKNSMEAGVISLVPLFENRKFRLPVGDEYSVTMIDQMIHELQAMSFVDGKIQGVGAHDDIPMALWIADQAVRRGGFSASFGEGEDADPSFDGDPSIPGEPQAPSAQAVVVRKDKPASEAENAPEEGTKFSATFDETDTVEPAWQALPFWR